mmetsp:Transcript_9254/g.37879  ORF Transcript_9254/g.37879 Transcript_9254/m.37879 type:complete len:210 (+) Transcript_9254:1051-1680(+)
MATSASGASRQLASAEMPSRWPPSPARRRSRKSAASSFLSGSANARIVVSANFLASSRDCFLASSSQTSSPAAPALAPARLGTYLTVSTSARTSSAVLSAGRSAVDLASSRIVSVAAATDLDASNASPPSECLTHTAHRASMPPAGISIAANSSDAAATRATSAVTTARVAGPSGSASPAFNDLTQAVAKASVASSAVCFLPPDACSHR